MFRIRPALEPQHMKTYQIVKPKTTHTRPGTCQDVDCAAYAHGWVTNIDVSTELGARQANYIRLQSGRRFTVSELGTLVSFTFPAGQQCFAEHRVDLGRPEVFRRVGGDWRGNPRRIQPAIMRPADWVDDFANHQDGIRTIIERG